MERVEQSLEEILGSLSPLQSSWQDETATAALEGIRAIPRKDCFSEVDVAHLLDQDFDTGLLICRLFLGLSDDDLQTALVSCLGQGTGIKRYRKEPAVYLGALMSLGLLDAMARAVNRELHWSDILEERLRSTRGKAIRGQKRGRGLEDFAENIIESVFGQAYETRCKFVGANGETAKCDFAIPNKLRPRILVEAKGYGATGSKMSDVIGDLNLIVKNKRHDTALLFLTDGVTWMQRKADLRKIVDMQNQGMITRIYTTRMRDLFRRDLETLKRDSGL